jgi:hypothetical protein
VNPDFDAFAAIDALRAGALPPDQMSALKAAVLAGDVVMPRDLRGALDTVEAPAAAPQPTMADLGAPALPMDEGPGIADTVRGIPGAIAEAVTGAQRRTATTEAASDITMSPEWRQISSLLPAAPKPGASPIEQAVQAGKTALAANPIGQLVMGGRMLGLEAASPEEQVQIIQANFPDLKVQRDERGNAFFQSSDGRTYSVQPGLRATDAPRAVAQIGSFLPAGGVAGVGRAVAANALTQAGLEAGQASAGGEFDTGEVAVAGLAGGAIPALQAGARGVRGALGAADEVVEAGAGAVRGAPMPEEALARDVRAAANGNKAAQARLAEAAAINPEARAAAERLGIELPADVFSDNDQIRAAIGLVRSKVGGEAEAAWRGQVRAAVEKADEAIAQFDVAFAEGSPSVGNVSDKVLTTLKSEAQTLDDGAAKLYREVDSAFKPTDKVQLNRTRDTLMQIAEEVGDQFTAEERKLLAELKRGDSVYGGLQRLKRQLGEAIGRGAGPFKDADQAGLKRLYAALAEDQLENAERVAGAEVRRKLRAANLLKANQKSIEERIVSGFGQDANGSIGALLQRSITQASKGDGAAFGKVLELVPAPLQREAIGTALASVTRAKAGAEAGGFGFSEWVKTYQGLRSNAPVYAQVVKVLGPESDRVMRDLYEVSKRVTDARALVSSTGKSLQPVIDQLGAESLIGKILSSTVGRGAVAAGAGAMGGPAGAMGASMLADAVSKASRDGLSKAGKLFASEEFQRLAIEAGTKPAGQVSRGSIRRVSMSKAWREFAKAARLPRRQPRQAEEWLSAAIQGGRQNVGER